MPSRRSVVALSVEEIQTYLAAHNHVVLVTNGPEGLPHAVPMHYGLDSDGCVIVTSYPKSQKVINLKRDPRATLLVESGNRYTELKGVIAYCNAEIIEDPARVSEAMRLIRTNPVMAASIEPAMSQQMQTSITKRVILRFEPFRFASWDHSKLGPYY